MASVKRIVRGAMLVVGEKVDATATSCYIRKLRARVFLWTLVILLWPPLLINMAFKTYIYVLYELLITTYKSNFWRLRYGYIILQKDLDWFII